MNASAVYNEVEPFAARWLERLADDGHIARGVVYQRSVRALQPSDVAGHGQRHFFAGIGGWSHALRLAGVPDDADIWTGSCPCQPFSGAGKRSGFDDDRHVWPDWFRLIDECRPPIIFGEQVASRDGLAWLDVVCADLEGAGYAVGSADLCAASVGAPHIRQRLFFVALADHHHRRREVIGAPRLHDQGQLGNDVARRRETLRMAYDSSDGLQGSVPVGPATRAAIGSGDFANPWRDVEWIPCRDGVARPVEPGTFPLAHGVPGRVGRLRGYGNAIVPQVAAAFVRAALGLT